MSGIVTWFVRNPVAANLLMASIVALGIAGLFRVKKEVFPEFVTDSVSVSVVYPGASPAEVESSICKRIEEEIQSVEGVDRLRSSAAEGVASVVAELIQGADQRKALDDIKSRVDAIDTFPIDAEEPIVTQVALSRQTLNIAISGPLDEYSLRELGVRVRDEVAGLPGITQVTLGSVREYEIAIEVSEEALQRHGITFDEVATAVSRSSLDLPGGSVKTRGGEILLRTKGQAYRGRDFEDLVLWTRPDGSRLELQDVATVVDGFAETDEAARFNGEPTVLVQVFRVGAQDAIAISKAVRDYVETQQASLPAGAKMTIWRDEAVLLRGRLDLLVRNGLQGFLLVFLVLALFLRLELAFWVTIGVPISFLGAFALMPGLDVSINMLSLFAFILVLGIVVDDAIVVGESIYTHSRRGLSGNRAAIEGTHAVAIPVTFAVLTTVAAFLPLFNVPGALGDFWAVIPTIVISTLVFSMVESKFVLPSHLRHLNDKPRNNWFGRVQARWSSLQGRFARGLELFAERVYRPILYRSIRNRYVTLSVATAVFAITLGMVGAGYVKFVFFPPVDGDNVVVDLTLPAGTPAERTSAELATIESVIDRLRDEFPGDIEHVMTSIGSQPFRKTQDEGPGKIVAGNSGGHFGEINIQLSPSEERVASSKAIENRWRELTQPVPGAVEFRFSSSLISVGSDLEVQLRGDDSDTLREAISRFEQHLASYPGVSDISNSYRAGKAEIELDIRESIEPLGLTMADLARQVRQGFYGAEAQRVQRGRDDIKVMVRYPRDERESLDRLEGMRIRTAQGDEIPFGAVAEMNLGQGSASIERIDRKRSISVTAEVDEDQTDVNAIIADLESDFLPRLQANFDGVSYSFEGEQKEQADTLGGLAVGGLLSLLLIYGLLAIPFRSYLQPLIVMSIIPFGLIGAIFGHLIMNIDLSVLSMCGIVALAGVVVNDSLVLVDFVNKSREAGRPLLETVREAGVARFRPIILTSLTTFAGLFPLLLEKSVQAKFLVPMAVSLAFGILFATVITLILVPCVYLMLEDLRRAFGWLYGKPTNPTAAAE